MLDFWGKADGTADVPPETSPSHRSIYACAGSNVIVKYKAQRVQCTLFPQIQGKVLHYKALDVYCTTVQ